MGGWWWWLVGGWLVGGGWYVWRGYDRIKLGRTRGNESPEQLFPLLDRYLTLLYVIQHVSLASQLLEDIRIQNILQASFLHRNFDQLHFN